jgi:hypothetical protein
MACFCYKCPEHGLNITKDRGCLSSISSRWDRVLDVALDVWVPEIFHLGTELVVTAVIVLLSSIALCGA